MCSFVSGSCDPPYFCISAMYYHQCPEKSMYGGMQGIGPAPKWPSNRITPAGSVQVSGPSPTDVKLVPPRLCSSSYYVVSHPPWSFARSFHFLSSIILSHPPLHFAFPFVRFLNPLAFTVVRFGGLIVWPFAKALFLAESFPGRSCEKSVCYPPCGSDRTH